MDRSERTGRIRVSFHVGGTPESVSEKFRAIAYAIGNAGLDATRGIADKSLRLACGCAISRLPDSMGGRLLVEWCRTHAGAHAAIAAIRGAIPVLETAIRAGLDGLSRAEQDHAVAEHSTLRALREAVAASEGRA